MKLNQGLLVSVWLCVLVGACIAQDGDKPADIEKPVEAVSHVEMEKPVEATNAEVTQPEEVEPRKGFTVKGLVSFANFKQRFHRVYNSFTEMLVRQKIFLMKAIQVVITHIKYKRRQLSYYYSVNQFSDRRPDELQSEVMPATKDGNQPTGGPVGPAKTYVNENGWIITQYEMDDSPDLSNNEIFYDWRTSGCFHKPKNQGECASCYVYATMSLLEYAHCVATGEHLTLSEQYIIDCGGRKGIHGCRGGLTTEVVNFVKHFGVILEEDYPYTGNEDTCKYGLFGLNEKMGYLKLSNNNVKQLSPSDYEEAIKHGPFQASVYTDLSVVQYGGGVYDLLCKETNSFNHAMAIVGSGKQDDKEYWIFRNSWDAHWGEEGYIRINKKSECVNIRDGYSFNVITEKEPPFTEKNESYEHPGKVKTLSFEDFRGFNI